ncbi:hypothetical protein ACQCVP_23600 [Rossellomorea vietnamensis]|uniref:hypothetical protein n=1 Tax=Rossellomorea vietnamensis TaxID=218284 RepID=UPI003CF9915D
MKKRRLLSGTLATCVLIGGLSISFNSASAAEVISPKTYESIQTQVAVNELASDMEFIFEEAASLEDGKYVLNEGLIAEKFGQENVASITAFVKMVNGEELSKADLVNVPTPAQALNKSVIKGDIVMAQDSWSECVGNKIIDATGIGFISGGMWKLIERKNWTKVATELAKIVGKNAIKGGVVGFAASLAWYSITC